MTFPLGTETLWTRADAIGGLADGDPVGTWFDSSGRGNDLVQATASKKPLYKTRIVNGLPVVRFDGVDDVLGNALTLPTVFTCLVVFNATGGGADRRLIGAGDASGGQHGYELRARNDAGMLAILRNAGANGDINPGENPTPGFEVFTVSVGAAGPKCWRDGVSKGGNTNITAVSTGGLTFHLGFSGDGGASPFTGDVAELILYSSQLSDPARQDAENYLISKYSPPSLVYQRVYRPTLTR